VGGSLADRIAVISSLPFVTTEITELLDFVGYEVVECSDLEEFMKQENIQLIIMYSNVISECFDWIKKIKTDTNLKGIPIILTIEKKEYGLLFDAYQIGISDYIELPIVDIELISKIALHIELKKNREHIENLYFELKESLSLATQLQKLMLPSSILVKNNIWFTSHYLPAQVIGGDIYDYIDLDGEIIGYIADISGHGVQSALLCSAVKSIVRSSVNRSTSIVDIVNELYDGIKLSLAHNYITGIFFKILENGTVEYINCGHPSIITYDGNHFQQLNMKNTFPIGLFDYTYTQDDVETFAIEDNVSYMLYSDGLYSEFERRYPNLNSINLLFEFLNKEISGILPEAVPFYIEHTMRKLYGEIPDDFSIVSFGKANRYIYIDKNIRLRKINEAKISELISLFSNYALSDEYAIFYNEHDGYKVILCKNIETGYLLRKLPISISLNFDEVSVIKLFS